MSSPVGLDFESQRYYNWYRIPVLPGTYPLPSHLRMHEARMTQSALSRRATFSPLFMAALVPMVPTRSIALPSSVGISRSSSGIRYIDFQEGSGPTPKYGQIIRFNYAIYGADDAYEMLLPFDSSFARNVPYLTKHGNGFTCEGVEEALHTMREGGRRRVIIPPRLGYTADKGPMPPSSKSRTQLFNAVSDGKPLIFDLEVSSA